MKKINLKVKQLLLATCLIFNFSACSFLDRIDPDKLGEKDFYKTEADMNLALNAAYDALKVNYYNNMYYWTEIRSDNTTLSGKTGNSGIYNDFDIYKLNSSNAEVQRAWYGLYTCIYRSNVVTDKIDAVKMDEVKKNQYKAQALFLRALSYYHLSQLFGDVPIVTKQLVTENEVLSYGRRPVAEVYDQIVKDLILVTESQLPDNWGFDGTNADFGRASKTAGYALLGKVYLTMAKRLNNGQRDTYLLSAKRALEKAFALKPFTDLNSINYAKVFGANNITCNEIIFQVMYLQGTDEGSPFAKNFQPENISGLISPVNGAGQNLPEENMIKEYEKNDNRKAISYTTSGATPYVKKYTDKADPQGRGGSCWIVIRYADVILMLAEVYEDMGIESTAITYLNMVRERAKLPVYEKTNDEYKSAYPTLKEAILHERRMELSFENHRWYDLLRFYTAEELITFLETKSAEGVGKRDLLMPIPLRETQLNPSKMYQNDGY